MVIEMADGILLKPKVPFEETRLDKVAGWLTYAGPPKSENEIDAAMRQAAKKAWHDRD